MNSLLRRAAWATALFAGGLLSLPAQQPVNAQPIHLPEFSVGVPRELPPAEVWHYTRIAGQEVLSSVSLNRTEQLARDLTGLLHALELSGTRLLPATPATLRIVIVDGTPQFDSFVRGALESGHDDPETGVLGSQEQPVLVVNAGANSLDFTRVDSSAAEETDVDDAALPTVRAANAARLLQLGYLRARLAQPRPPLPPWLIEGVAQVLVWARITENSVTLGQVEDPNENGSIGGMDREPGRVTRGDLQHRPTHFRDSLSAQRDFNTALAHSALFPLEELFMGNLRNFPGSENSARLVRWQKQCHAFVHWGLFGDYGRNSAQFLNFTRRLRSEPLSEALFQECFGLNYAAGLQTLRTHVEMTRSKVQGVKVNQGEKLPPAPPVEVRPATPLEVARLKSYAFAVGGQPEKARDELADAYRRGERTPDLVAELALAELNLGNDERGRRYLDLAVKGRTTRTRAYTTLARLRLDERRAKPQAPGGKLSYEQLVGVLEPLILGRQQAARSPELYLLLAEAWAFAAVPPPPQHLALLDEGTQLFPDEARLRAARERLGPSANPP